MKRTLLFLLALTVSIMFGCVKKRAGESAEQLRARKSAVYVAQSYTALVGWSDATEILARAQQTTTARASYQINERVRLVVDRVAAAIQAGKPADALGLVERGLVEIEAAETSGVFQINDPAARERFFGVLVGVKLGLTSLRAVLAATREPDAPGEARTALRLQTAPPNAPWWTELIALGERTALRLWRQSRLDAAVAWRDATSLSGELARKNAERIAQ